MVRCGGLRISPTGRTPHHAARHHTTPHHAAPHHTTLPGYDLKVNKESLTGESEWVKAQALRETGDNQADVGAVTDMCRRLADFVAQRRYGSNETADNNEGGDE